MNSFVLIISFLAGLLFGSFLNVCIYRIPRDLSVITPRSFCPECGAQLRWFENIPLLSFLLQRARCRHCRRPIGPRYPLVELVTALAFLFIVRRYGTGLPSLKWLIFEMLLIILFWTDFEERLLPDEFTLGGAVLGFVFSLFVPVPGVGQILFVGFALRWASLLNGVLGALILALPIWAIGSLYSRLRKRQALGLGDVKLLLMIGCFLGLQKGIVALFLASVGGASLGVALLIWKGREALSYGLPLGSFLCAAAALIPFLSSDISTNLLAVP